MKVENTYSDVELLSLLQKDSEYAFTLIYDRYKNLIYSVAIKLLKSSFSAEEIVQEVFLKLWARREHLVSVENLEAYIFITARNIIFDRIKKVAKEVVLQERALQNFSQQEDKTDFRVRERQIDEILFKITELLPPQQRIVFNLVKGQGMSHEKVAEKLQISPLTVKKHMSQALKFIRRHLNNSLSIGIALLFIRH